MENALLLILIFFVGILVGSIGRRTKTEYVYLPSKFQKYPERFIIKKPKDEEECFLDSTIIYEETEYTQRNLMQEFRNLHYQVYQQGNKFFVKIPHYSDPIKINFFAFKYFNTLN